MFLNPANNCLAKMGSCPPAALARVRIFYCCYSLVLNAGNLETRTGSLNYYYLVYCVVYCVAVARRRLLASRTDSSCCMFLLFLQTLRFSNFRRGTLRGLFQALWFCATAERARARFGPPPRARNAALCARAKAYQRRSKPGSRRKKFT